MRLLSDLRLRYIRRKMYKNEKLEYAFPVYKMKIKYAGGIVIRTLPDFLSKPVGVAMNGTEHYVYGERFDRHMKITYGKIKIPWESDDIILNRHYSDNGDPVPEFGYILINTKYVDVSLIKHIIK